jgi:hypothetical protein
MFKKGRVNVCRALRKTARETAAQAAVWQRMLNRRIGPSVHGSVRRRRRGRQFLQRVRVFFGLRRPLRGGERTSFTSRGAHGRSAKWRTNHRFQGKRLLPRYPFLLGVWTSQHPKNASARSGKNPHLPQRFSSSCEAVEKLPHPVITPVLSEIEGRLGEGSAFLSPPNQTASPPNIRQRLGGSLPSGRQQASSGNGTPRPDGRIRQVRSYRHQWKDGGRGGNEHGHRRSAPAARKGRGAGGNGP